MSMQDPIADLFSRINNAQTRKKSSVVVPSSNKKISLVSLLKDKGYIDSFNILVFRCISRGQKDAPDENRILTNLCFH